MAEPSRSSPQRLIGTGLPLGRVLGVPVFVSPSTLILVIFIALTYSRPNQASSAGTSTGYAVAVAFALLLVASVFLHELGHCVTSQAVGVRVRSITLYMLGGVTTTDTDARDPGRAYLITLAGPLVSLLLAAGAAVTAPLFPAGTIARELAVNLTWVNLIIAIFNMLPGLPLDGGQLVRAGVWRLSGNRPLATKVAGWTGRALAVGLLIVGALMTALGAAGGYVNLFWTALLAAFIWVGATQAMRSAAMVERLPRLHAGRMARPVVTVPPDLPLAEALRRLTEQQAGGIVVVDSDGNPSAVVVEEAVSATPEQRRPWVTVGAVARALGDGLTMRADLIGSDIVTAIQAHPATEYVVLDDRGGLVGVLRAADVAGVLQPAAR
ncbi:MAG: site-2 protease family protein [Mycobacteriales bacterium]